MGNKNTRTDRVAAENIRRLLSGARTCPAASDEFVRRVRRTVMGRARLLREKQEHGAPVPSRRASRASQVRFDAINTQSSTTAIRANKRLASLLKDLRSTVYSIPGICRTIGRTPEQLVQRAFMNVVAAKPKGFGSERTFRRRMGIEIHAVVAAELQAVRAATRLRDDRMEGPRVVRLLRTGDVKARAALRRLALDKPDVARLIDMHCLQGMSVTDIANALSVPKNVVASRIHRAYAHLTSML